MAMKALNTVRKVEKIRVFAALIAIGLIFTVVGVFFILNPADTSNLVDIEATISDIVEIDKTNTEKEYQVFVDYEADGVSYTHVPYNSYDSFMKVGKTVKAQYDVNDPSKVHAPGSGIIVYIILAAGIACLAIGIVNLKKSISTKVDDMDEYNQVDMNTVTQEMVDSVANSTEEQTNYTFHYAKFLNQSYVLEDEDRNVVFDCDLKKFSLFMSSTYEFVNRLTGNRVTYAIGHTVTTTMGSRWNVPISRSFKIDGIDNWKYLADKGYSLDFSLEGLSPCYTVSQYGVPVAFIKTGGTNIITGKNNKLGDLPVNGLFYVSCRESNLDMIALICFSIARAIILEANNT